MKRSCLLFLTAALLAGLLFGCGWIQPTPTSFQAMSLPAVQPAGAQQTIYKVYGADLQLLLPQEVCRLSPGTSLSICPRLSRSVTQSIAYSVADPTIAQVDAQGIVTGISHGVTTVTAVLPGGHRASRQVEVMTQARALTLPEKTVKLRPGTTRAIELTVTPAQCSETLQWTSSDPSIATVDQTGTVTGLQYGTVTVTCTAAVSGVSAQAQVKVCDLKQIALTFDDGPNRNITKAVLDLLEQYDIQATFFLVGKSISSNANLITRMVQAGHDLGYHTWGHKSLAQMTPQKILEDLALFQSTLQKVCGKEATLYRAPYGDLNDQVLQTVPLPHIEWTVDTRDWENQDAEMIKDCILNNLYDGGVILMHDIRTPTYEGLKLALKQIRRKGMDVEFITVTQLLSRDGTPPEAGKTYRKG